MATAGTAEEAAPAGETIVRRSAEYAPMPKAPTIASAMALRLNVFACIDFS